MKSYHFDQNFSKVLPSENICLIKNRKIDGWKEDWQRCRCDLNNIGCNFDKIMACQHNWTKLRGNIDNKREYC